MKRICLFAGYDKNGLIDDYVIYYLKEMAKIADVYYYGDFEPKEGELDKISSYVKASYAKRHKKYDYGSWQELCNIIGWSNIQKYDQLILANDSCYGPLFPIHEVFDEMGKKQVDFWGLSCGRGYHIHLQSYFLVFDKTILKSTHLLDFLNEVKVQPSLREVCDLYEDRITFYLRKQGFKYASYVPYGDFVVHPYYETWRSIKDKRFPFLKVKVFDGVVGYDRKPNWRSFLRKYTDYDVSLIENNLKNRGYTKKAIRDAVVHKNNYSMGNLFKIFVRKSKSLVKRIVKPAWDKYISKFDHRFVGSRIAIEHRIDQLNEKIESMHNEISISNKGKTKESLQTSAIDFVLKYKLIKKNLITLKSDASSKKDIEFGDSPFASFNIYDILKEFKKDPYHRHDDAANILFIGKHSYEDLMKPVLDGDCVVSLNNKVIRNNIESKLLSDYLFETKLMCNFSFLVDKDRKAIFDLIIVNTFLKEVSEEEIIHILDILSNHMLEESVLIVSIPKDAKPLDAFVEILQEVGLLEAKEYNYLFHPYFSNISGNAYFVLKKM